jgi:hypothetical protein
MSHRILPRVPRVLRLFIALLLTLPLAACPPKNDDLVVITYYPVTSFRSYENVNKNDPGDVHKSFVDNQSQIFTVYRISSVVNQGKNAAPFAFDVGKIRAGSPESFFGNATLATNENLLNVTDFLVPVGFKDNVVPGTKTYEFLPRLRILIRTPTTVGEEQVAAKLTYTDPNGRKVLMVLDTKAAPQTLLNPGTPDALSALAGA